MIAGLALLARAGLVGQGRSSAHARVVHAKLQGLRYCFLIGLPSSCTSSTLGPLESHA
jgi:hypothetical protein